MSCYYGRQDGKGDAWANAHRRNLDSGAYMFDVDGLEVQFAPLSVRGQDRFFLECALDDASNDGSPFRDMGLVAVFDRKRSRPAAGSTEGRRTTAVYAHICTTYREIQPVAPRFFFVYGDRAPWTMEEMDLDTGRLTGDLCVLGSDRQSWQYLWDELGLPKARKLLNQWLRMRRVK